MPIGLRLYANNRMALTAVVATDAGPAPGRTLTATVLSPAGAEVWTGPVPETATPGTYATTFVVTSAEAPPSSRPYSVRLVCTDVGYEYDDTEAVIVATRSDAA